MTTNLSAYLPQDRRRALARGESLPNRTTGAALFADISGFTALTEQLRHTLGSRRGVETLMSQINAVYAALIAEIERHGGSVISFAGDAVMCWFDAGQTTDDGRQTTAARAAACGLAMQAAMRQFPKLGLKVAVASGPARRFVVGDPQIHYLDALAAAADFTFDAYPAARFKGKAEAVSVFAVAGRQKRSIRLQEPAYALPMVGRVDELALINDKLEQTLTGQSQIVGIIAEAGLGKSRLAAEVVRVARQKGFAGYGGACQSDAVSTPYHVWKTVWRAFFDVDPETPLPELMRRLEGEIADRAPLRVAAMPLLNVLLGANIPENDFTRTLDPKTRQSALHALLEDCLKAATQEEPALIVIVGPGAGSFG